MSASSLSAAPAGKPSTFELKSAQLPLVALLVKSADYQKLKQEWLDHYAQTPDFFDQDPVVLDFSPIAEDDSALPPLEDLVALLRSSRLCPIAVRGGNAAQLEAALRTGLVAAPDAVLSKAASAPPTSSPNAEPPAAPAAQVEVLPVVPQAGMQQPALVVDKPLRSGQQVYARGRDLVVLAMVNPGAEVIADGHIHVYAPLRGRAIAGARGDGSARIFALQLQAELLAIAGIYRTSEVPLPAEVAGRAAMVQLASGPEGDKLLMKPLAL